MFAAQGPRGCAPLEPQAGGAPCTARLISAFRRPCRGLRRGAGVPGEERPRHPAGRLGSLRSRQGAVSSPCGAAGRTNPLTRPLLEKRARGPRRGLEGHCRSGWGSRLAQRPRSGLALTPRNDPNAPGWWLGVLFPQPPATWRTRGLGQRPKVLATTGGRRRAQPVEQGRRPLQPRSGHVLCEAKSSEYTSKKWPAGGTSVPRRAGSNPALAAALTLF